jgi:hypothetical protein
MKPGERIDCIKGIAQTLSGQTWVDIDLTLSQFGFPTTDEWSGNAYTYVLYLLREGSDEALAELSAYLHPEETTLTQPEPDRVEGAEDGGPWKTGGFRLFFSHTSAHKKNISKLSDALSAHAIEAFVAHETITPGEDWINVIRSGLRTCDALAAWLRPTFRESDYCDQEVGAVDGQGKLVVPVRFGLDPYGFIGNYQAITVRDQHPFPELARSIFDLVVRHELSREAMARALVWRYENSGNYDAARANVGALRMIPAEAWTDSIVRRARTAHEENSQLRDAFVGARFAPEVVDALLKDLDR